MKLQFKQFCFKDSDDTNVWVAEINCNFKICHDDLGNVWIEDSGGRSVGDCKYKVKGEEATRKKAIEFLRDYFHQLWSVVAHLTQE